MKRCIVSAWCVRSDAAAGGACGLILGVIGPTDLDQRTHLFQMIEQRLREKAGTQRRTLTPRRRSSGNEHRDREEPAAGHRRACDRKRCGRSTLTRALPWIATSSPLGGIVFAAGTRKNPLEWCRCPGTCCSSSTPATRVRWAAPGADRALPGTGEPIPSAAPT